MLLMAIAGRRKRRLREDVVDADYRRPWLYPGDCYDVEDEPVDPPEWVYTYPPDGGDPVLVSATRFTDRPPW